jgi:parallel beta-helix repeat protein
LFGVFGGCGENFICSGNTITDSNGGGIGIYGYYPIIRYNEITNSGLFAGMCPLKGGGIEIIDTSNTGATIEYNRIINSGGNGIFPRGSYNLVKNNFISYFGLTIDDCGGIYCSGEFYVGDQIIGNIVTYGLGNRYGLWPSGTTTGTACEGIYLDSVTANKVVYGNTVAYCGSGGMRTHDSYNITITGNTLFSNRYGFYVVKSINNVSYSRNIIFNNNISVSTTNSTWTQYPYRIINYVNESPLLFGSSDYNYIMKPINDINTFDIEVNSVSHNYYNLSTWQSYSSNDLNSSDSPKTISSDTQIRFEYNTGTTNLIVPLERTYMKVDGSIVTNSITLSPYTSIILFESGIYKIINKSGKLVLKNGKILIMN